MSKCNKIRRIVRIQQMLKRWRLKAKLTAACAPSDVPAGHVAVCVGADRKRFVVRASYLNHPIFKTLLIQAEEEYGFRNAGPLTIPCDESVFEEILSVVSRSCSGSGSGSGSGRLINVEEIQRCCHVSLRKNFELVVGESRPLLHG